MNSHQPACSVVNKHPWYLDSTLIPLALLDNNIPDKEKVRIAAAILAHSSKFYELSQFTCKSREESDITNGLDFEQSSLLSLKKLVNDYLMFSFISLGITKEQLRDCFALTPGYCFKRQFAFNLGVVNDDAERDVGTHLTTNDYKMK